MWLFSVIVSFPSWAIELCNISSVKKNKTSHHIFQLLSKKTSMLEIGQSRVVIASYFINLLQWPILDHSYPWSVDVYHKANPQISQGFINNEPCLLSRPLAQWQIAVPCILSVFVLSVFVANGGTVVHSRNRMCKYFKDIPFLLSTPVLWVNHNYRCNCCIHPALAHQMFICWNQCNGNGSF